MTLFGYRIAKESKIAAEISDAGRSGARNILGLTGWTEMSYRRPDSDRSITLMRVVWNEQTHGMKLYDIHPETNSSGLFWRYE